MKRLLALFLSFTCLILPGCSAEQSGAGEKQKTLTVYSTISSDSERAVFRKLADSFQKEHPDIQVNVHFPGNDYENMMRVRMAAGDMPDLFDTHGWAKIRYGEYTADLSGMSWTKRLDSNLNSMLKDAKGRIYAFPLNQAKDGLAYNRTLLEKYRIKPPETMDDFMKALRQIKEKSGGTVTPLLVCRL